jgi:AcrR family transcriptional regulator
MTSVVVRPRSGSAGETRVRILAEALELMAEHGYAATSTREVCERMGFTKAALYYHFRSKDELLFELVEPLVSDLRALVPVDDAVSSPAARRALLTAYVDLVLGRADLIRVLYEDPSVRRHPALAEATEAYSAMVRSLSGLAEPALTARARARGALGAVNAVLLRAEPGDDRAELRAAALAAGCGALGVPAPRHP